MLILRSVAFDAVFIGKPADLEAAPVRSSIHGRATTDVYSLSLTDKTGKRDNG